MPPTWLRPTLPSGCATSSPNQTCGPSRPPACSTRSSPISTASGSRPWGPTGRDPLAVDIGEDLVEQAGGRLGPHVWFGEEVAQPLGSVGRSHVGGIRA